MLEAILSETREGGERFNLIANTAPLVWMSNADRDYTDFNKPWPDVIWRSLEGEVETTSGRKGFTPRIWRDARI
jgi:hypothetical protein